MSDYGPRFFGVMDEDPFDFQTWSGSSNYFFRALEKLGCLTGAAGTEPSRLVSALLKIKNFRPGLESWRFNYHIDTTGFELRTRAALHAMAGSSSKANCVLQVGAWYDMTKSGLPTVSYHDGNLMRRLDNPHGYPRVPASRIQRALSFERDLYQKIDLIFPMSQWLASSFVKDFGVDEEKVCPVYAGVNLPDKDVLKPASYDSRQIVFVGKDFERKGGPDLLEAFKLLRKNMPDARLTIVGPALEIDSPGVESLGPISKSSPAGLARLEEVYRSAAVFIMPTLYEPFGIAFAEAMSNGLPCIGTRICAVPELIEEGTSGVLVEPRNPGGLARAAFELLSDPSLCEKMGAAGFQRYRENFRWDVVAEKICKRTAAIVR